MPKSKKNQQLARAIEQAGGVSTLARKLNVHPSVVGMWRVRGSVPAEYCIALEQALESRMTRYQLRPDVFLAPQERGSTP